MEEIIVLKERITKLEGIIETYAMLAERMSHEIEHYRQMCEELTLGAAKINEATRR